MILIDPPLWPAHGRRWSHVVSDSSLRELHSFAAELGIPERAFEGDHYDVPEDRHAHLVSAGAVPVSSRELLRRLQVSGLRRSKRRGERVLASRRDSARGQRIDSVVSALAPLGPVTRVHVVLFHAGDLLVLEDAEGYLLPVADVAAPEQGVQRAGRQLAAGLVGEGWAALAARQVGYLRRVPDGRTRPTVFEVVLRWPDVVPPDVVPPDVVPRPVRPAGGAPRGVPPPVGPGQVSPLTTSPLTSSPRWIGVREALSLLPVDVAAVAAPEYHRLRPDRADDLGPDR